MIKFWKFFLIIWLCFFNIAMFSQMDKKVAEELGRKNIRTKEQLQEILKKNNLTEEQARALAKQYGMDFDNFINTFLANDETKLKRSYSFFAAFKDTLKETSQDTLLSLKQIKELSSKELKDSLDIFKIDTIRQIEISKRIKEYFENMEKEKLSKKYFGYEIFKDKSSDFNPKETGPIDPGYVIAPGDVLRIYIWGDVEFQYELQVDQQGNIFIPTAGLIFVAGTKYEDLLNKLKNFLSKFHAGLVSNPPTVFLDVSIARVRPIKIFILGEVEKPGGYSISSYATVFNALYAVEGPKITGSLRNIRVIRNNKVIAEVDLYDYLLKGQLIGDVRLQNNDVVFVPPRVKSVEVVGEVLRPMIYELKENENFQSLLAYCGGLKATASISRAHIERIKPFSQRNNEIEDKIVVDVDLSKVLIDKKDIELFDQDKIIFYPIFYDLKNYIVITGSVKNPGRYELKSGWTISEAVEAAGGLLPEAYLEKADVLRTRDDMTRSFATIDLGKAIKNIYPHNLRLQNRDTVIIYSKYDFTDKKYISIVGYVKEPLIIEYADSLTVYDLVFKTGKYLDSDYVSKAFLDRFDIIRYDEDRTKTYIYSFSLKDIIERKNNEILKAGDKIILYKRDVIENLEEYVFIFGEVKKPGKYLLSKNMTPEDLILQAEGFTELAQRSFAYVSRVDKYGYPGNVISERYEVPLASNLNSKEKSNFLLKDKDIVVIRKNPKYEPQRLVRLEGEVKYPGIYVLEKKNETILELLERAGGPKEESYLFGAVFERQGIRVSANLEEAYLKKKDKFNIQLQNGDYIYIPKKPNSVVVLGEVNTKGLFKFIPGWTVMDYINNAGGLTNEADYAILTQANGESRRINFGWFSSDPEVFDGAKIEVIKKPPKTEETTADYFNLIKDIFAIASSAITIIVLAKQIK